jgi:phage terminase large subunit
MKREVNGHHVYYETRDAFDAGAEVVIHKGGTGSGKTYQIMMFLIFGVALNNAGQVITVVSESKPHLDIGAIRIAKALVSAAELDRVVTYNETKSYFTFQNGTILEFFSADRIDKALGARRDWLYGNEINSLKVHIWDELARRSTHIIGDFNPTAEFWLEDWMRYYPKSQIIKSTYLDNQSLPE